MNRIRLQCSCRTRAAGAPLVLLALLCVLALLSASPPALAAEQVVELWRGGNLQLNAPHLVAANPAGGSCWVADPPYGLEWGGLLRLDANGGLQMTRRNLSVNGLSVDPTDDSCWIAAGGAGLKETIVTHVAADGTELLRLYYAGPKSVSVNPADGSCWIAAYGASGPKGDPGGVPPPGNSVIHVAADGTQLWRSTDIQGACSVSVDVADGSCWVADGVGNRVVHLAADGTQLSSTPGFYLLASVSVDPGDHSCWVADTGNNRVVHLDSNGDVQSITPGFNQPMSVSVSPDHSCWVADTANSQVVHLAANGDEVWRGSNFTNPGAVSVSSVDGACFVADTGGGHIVRLAANGQEVWRVGSPQALDNPLAVAVDPGDGSCWVVDGKSLGGCKAAHFAEDGRQLWQGGELTEGYSASVDPSDGSCWMAGWGKVVRVAPDGTTLCSHAVTYTAYSVAVNPNDSTCWVAVENHMVPGDASVVMHLASDGTELAIIPGFGLPRSVAVNPTDNSVWVANWSRTALTGSVVHLAADGSTISVSGGFLWPVSLSVNPMDGSCWVADMMSTDIVQLAADGSEARRVSGFLNPHGICVNPVDGTCWVADTENYQIVHLSPLGAELSRTGGFEWPSAVAVNADDSSIWVADSGKDQLVHLAIIPSNGPPVAGDDAVTTDEDTPASIAVLANDSDPDGDTLTIDSITQPAHGTATINGVAIDYVPAQDYSGTDSYTYTVSDGNGGSATATVNIEVTPVNDPPVAIDDAVTTPEDTAITITVLANDYDVEGDSIVVDSVTQPAHGTATRNADGTIIYEPSADFCGEDSFTYTISDVREAEHPPADGGGGETPPGGGGETPPEGGGENPPEGGETAPEMAATGTGLLGANQVPTNVARVTVTVTPVNDAPVAAFNFSPQVPTTEDTVAFADGSSDMDGAIASWAWDFGDGATATGPNPTHQYGARGTYTVRLTVTDDGGAGATAAHDMTVPGNTPTGPNVTLDLGSGVTINFAQVTTPGDTTVTTSTSPPAGPPSGFQFLGTYYDISTTAGYVPPITITIAYGAGIPPGREKHAKLLHWNGVEWQQVTVVVDTVNHVMTAQVSSLSWFAIAWPEYTFLGFLPPVGDADHKPFKRGSTIPIKFRIRDVDGTPVTGAIANLSVFYLVAGAPSGEPEVVSTAAGDWGNQFRYDPSGDLYIFNLSTKSYSYLAPYTYLARVTLDDGSVHEVEFGLK